MILPDRWILWRMSPAELKTRTMQFAVRVLKFADALPNKPSGRTIASQGVQEWLLDRVELSRRAAR